MNFPFSNQDGFTLIEVIVSLIIMGFVGAIAGMGIVQIVDGYILAKESSETVQKSQIAMTRLMKEFHSLTGIDDVTLPSISGITYIRNDGSHTLSYEAELGLILLDDNTLLDNVRFFSLKYYDKYDDPTPVDSDSSGGFTPNTKLVDIFFEMNGPENMVHKLETRVFLRGLIEGQ